MANVYEMARQLGEEILQSEVGRRLFDARFIFDGDEEAQKLLFDYTDLANKLSEMVQNPGREMTEEFGREKERLDALMEQVKANDNLVELLDAEAKMYALMEQVMNIIASTVKGEDESCGGCSGGCSGCSGCH